MNIEPGKFTFEERTLEVRAFLGTDTVKASVFEGEEQVLPKFYNVPLELVVADRMQKNPVDMIRFLMESVQIIVEKGAEKLISLQDLGCHVQPKK